MLSFEELRCLGGVPREQKMLKGLLPRVMYHKMYSHTNIKVWAFADRPGEEMGMLLVDQVWGLGYDEPPWFSMYCLGGLSV